MFILGTFAAQLFKKAGTQTLLYMLIGNRRGCEWLSNVNMRIPGIVLCLTLVINVWRVDTCYDTPVVQPMSCIPSLLLQRLLR